MPPEPIDPPRLGPVAGPTVDGPMADGPMADDPMADDRTVDEAVDAGPFGEWLSHMQEVLDGRAEADVPCGSCVACCSSRQFVHVEPDEVRTLARIPAELRFPAPGLPAGHVVLPYDASGRCPMLDASGCSIYGDRPRTCRSYDCRIFTAAGMTPDEDQPLIAERVGRWRFDVADGDRIALAAVRVVARALADPSAHPDARVPSRANVLAAMAIGLHPLAIDGEHVVEPAPATVRVAISRRRG